MSQPWFLLLALLVPLALWKRRAAPPVLFAPPVDGLPKTWRVRLRSVPRLLQVVGLLLLAVAMARPVERVPLPHETEGIDIMLCLDTSSSMAQNDLDPARTRLDVAKAAAARFAAGRPDDRVGIVTFARYPDLRCPPTLDRDALQQFLKAIGQVRGDGPEDATGIGTAVARAAQVLGGAGAKSRVVILLTDGEENVATKQTANEIAPLHAGQLCRRLGVRVYAIAAGLGKRDRNGEWVELDTRQVRWLAERTGGKFFAARDAGAVEAVYREIDELERVAFEEPRYRTVEAFLPFLVFALLLLALGRAAERTIWETVP